MDEKKTASFRKYAPKSAKTASFKKYAEGEPVPSGFPFGETLQKKTQQTNYTPYIGTAQEYTAAKQRNTLSPDARVAGGFSTETTPSLHVFPQNEIHAAKSRAKRAANAERAKNMLPVTQAGIAQDYTQGKDTGEKGVFPRPNQAIKRHFELMNYDSDAANAEIEANEAARKNAALEIEKRAAYLAEQGISEQDFSLDDEYMRLVREANRDTSERDAQLRREIKEASDYQKMQGYYALADMPDFERKSGRTAENNRLDKAVYDEWYGDPQEYIDALDRKHRAEYEEILEKYGQAAADQYLATHINDEGGYRQYNLGELTDEERRIFNYILNTEGDGSAEEYLKFMAENLNYRKAQREFENVQKMSRAEQNLYGFFNAKEAGYDQFAQGLAGWLTDEEIPATSAMIENSLYNEAQGKWGRTIHSVLTSGFNMLPSMIIGLANPTAGSVAFGISAGGNYRQEALKAGYTNEQATAYGILAGASEVALQKLIGGMTALGGEGLSSAVRRIPGASQAMVKISDALGRISIGKQTAARSVLKAIDKIGGEFADEYLQEILNPVFRNICLGENNEFKPFTAEALEAGIVGALMAVGGNIAYAPRGVINAYTDSKNAYNTAHVRENVAALLENTASVGRAETAKQRDILKSKLDGGEKIDAGDVAAYTATLTAEEIADGFGGGAVRTAEDIGKRLVSSGLDAGRAEQIGQALYAMQSGEYTDKSIELVRSSEQAVALFNEYFHADITAASSDAEVRAAAENQRDEMYYNLSPDAQTFMKAALRGGEDTQEARAAFYKAYLEGYTGQTRRISQNSAISETAQSMAYDLGAEAKDAVGTFKTVNGATISKQAAAFFSRMAQELNVAITYGGSMPVVSGGFLRGYMNTRGGLHIYADAKVKGAGGRTLYGADAAAIIVAGHELTHRLRQLAPEEYAQFRDFAVARMGGAARIGDYSDTLGLSPAEAMDEMASDYAMEKLFWDKDVIRRITKKHSRLAEAIRNALLWIRDKLGFRSSDFDTAVRLWNDAYNAAARNKNTPSEWITKYSKQAFENNLIPYTDFRLQMILSDQNNIVAHSIADVHNFVKEALSNAESKKRLHLGAITEQQKSKILSDIPNLTQEKKDGLFKQEREYSLVVSQDAVRHLFDNKKSMTEEDAVEYICNLSQIVNSYDSVYYTEARKGQNILHELLFKKQFSDGQYVSVEIVSKKKSELQMHTIYMNSSDYINKKAAYKTVPVEIPPGLTSETPTVSLPFTNSISHQSKNVKVNNYENKKIRAAPPLGTTNGASNRVLTAPNNNVSQNTSVVNSQYMQKSEKDTGEMQKSIAGSEEIAERLIQETELKEISKKSAAEALIDRENAARAGKREFLPDEKTVEEITLELEKLGLKKGVTRLQLKKAITDAAVAMRRTYLVSRINVRQKQTAAARAADKLFEAAGLVDSGNTGGTAEAISEILYQVSTSDRKTVRQLVEEYGAIRPGEKPARMVSVPKRTSPERNVSQTVRTVMEARVTPDAMLPTIEDAIESGDFSYETVTDRASLAKARSRVARDYQGALDDFHAGVRSGKLSKDQVAVGLMLYNQAANAGTAESSRTAMDILVDIADSARSAAQSLQAMRLLKKLSPESQLYAAQRAARKISEKLTGRQKRKMDGARGAIDGAILIGREDAAEEMARSVSMLGQGVPVEKWIDEIGLIVSAGVSSRMKPKTERERIVSRNVIGDLLQFAEDYLPRAAGSKKSKTAAERLADYFANKDNYEKAWDKAKQALLETYADDPDALKALDRFLAGTLSGEAAQSSVAMRAIARAAIESDNGVRRLALRATLGDADGVAADIFARLNETVRAEGADAADLRDAILGYVHETAAETASPEAVQGKIREAVREVGTTMSEIIRSGAEDRAETLRRLERYILENIGISENAAQTAIKIIDSRFTAMTEEKSRAALDAILKERPKSMRKTAVERFTEYANLGAFRGNYNEKLSQKLFGDAVKVNEALAEKFLQAKTNAERDEILKDIYRDIGRQMPSTFLEKWTAWRYLCMLFNPMTHLRNIGGNTGNAPLVAVKDKIAFVLERVFIRDRSKRTKAVLLGSGELVRAAESDFEALKDDLFDGEKYKDNINANKYIREGHRVFADRVKIGGKGILNHLYDLTGNLLSAEDMIFKKQYYIRALASFCKARGITAEQIKSGKGLDAARAYAVREAQKATFNDANAFSNFVSGRSRYALVNLVKSTVLPFQRTPANILARGVEYSPVGLMKSLTYDAARVYRGEISGAEMIDNIAAGLTGTGLMALGAFLVSLGLVKFRGFDGGDDDKERKFEEMYGHQQYSIEVFGKSVTLDWLAPESIPFFAGVNLMEALGDGADYDDVLQVMKLFTDPMMNMSMLQGLNDSIENAKWSETDPLMSVSFGILDNLISQNLPTLGGKIERIAQSDRMTTYVDRNKSLPRDMQRFLGKLSQKVPGWDYSQIPYWKKMASAVKYLPELIHNMAEVLQNGK